MGVGNLQQALTAYGKGVVPYAQLYFDSSPLRHAAAWRKLASLGDDSSTYLWRVLAAREIMRQYRDDPQAAPARGGAAVAQGLGRGGPAPGRAHAGLRRPLRDRARAGVGRAAGRSTGPSSPRYGLSMDPSMGMLAGRIKQSPRLYRALRPQALAVLQALGAGDARDLGQPAADRHEHGARQGLPARAGRDRPGGDARLLAAHHGLRLRHRPRVPQPRPGARLPVRARPPGGARD